MPPSGSDLLHPAKRVCAFPVGRGSRAPGRLWIALLVRAFTVAGVYSQ